MVWPFGKKKQEQPEEPQGPDFVGALRVVAGRVLGFLGCSPVEMTRNQKTAVVRSIWIVRSGESFPRLITCYIL